MKRMEVEHFGPIEKADIVFGDLTVLVGPQASGKSLFVQLLKAIEDAGAIRSDLNENGFDWLHGDVPCRDYCSLYFGGGLEGVVQTSTLLHLDGKRIDFAKIVKPAGRARPSESMFLIPAQRVLVLQDGWPKPFMGYSVGDPYCMRRFSDSLRLLMDQGLGRGEAIFPQSKRLKAELKEVVDKAIYIGAELRLQAEGMRKRIVLAPRGDGASLPYYAWSAGQREFTPLLLGLYWLMPPGKVSRRAEIDTVIIEEPEMGLHPQAIVSFVEVHSAETSGVSEVEGKLLWLREFLGLEPQRTLAALPREYHWVARINIPKHTPQYRRLNAGLRTQGLKGPVKALLLS